jgi:hypothetical protein
MNRMSAHLARPLLGLFFVILLAGCAATFSPGSAREVSRDRLLQISETGKADHLTYMGSDFNYHYVFDSRSGRERTYKVRVTDMKLANTFSIGEDSYVLLPWVIEGQLMGSKPTDLEVGDPGVEAADKSREVDDDEVKSEEASRVGRTAQPIVDRPPQTDVREGLGDDQVETGPVQTP